MNLFINAVSFNGKLLLFDTSRDIIAQTDISLLLNESSQLIGAVDSFLKEYNVSFSEIKNIVVVHGPGSFTGIRTIVLFVNTLAFIYKELYITPVSFFELFSHYPIVKTSSKRDLFVKYTNSDIIEIVSIQDFLLRNTQNKIYGDAQNLDISCQTYVDYQSIIKDISLCTYKRVEPLYIKKPNIS